MGKTTAVYNRYYKFIKVNRQIIKHRNIKQENGGGIGSTRIRWKEWVCIGVDSRLASVWSNMAEFLLD